LPSTHCEVLFVQRSILSILKVAENNNSPSVLPDPMKKKPERGFKIPCRVTDSLSFYIPFENMCVMLSRALQRMCERGKFKDVCQWFILWVLSCKICNIVT
ncbi:hypothetical protein DPEC_G00304920, partial [Dallia pectoralis]